MMPLTSSPLPRGGGAGWGARFTLHASLFTLLTDREDRTRGCPDHPGRHAPKEQPLEPVPAVGAHDDQVSFFPLRGFHDLLKWHAARDLPPRGHACPPHFGGARLQGLLCPLPLRVIN